MVKFEVIAAMNNMVALLLVTFLIGTASALFEDQAFKFDWKQSFIGTYFSYFTLHTIKTKEYMQMQIYHSGHVTHAGFFSSSKASVFVVATESHVVMKNPQ